MDVLPPDWLCDPCRDIDHANCLGWLVFCCCFTEALIEVEES